MPEMEKGGVEAGQSEAVKMEIHCSSILMYLFPPKTTQPVLFPQCLRVYAVYTSVVGAVESLIRMLVQSRLTLADSNVPVKKSKASYPAVPRTQPSGSQHRVSS